MKMSTQVHTQTYDAIILECEIYGLDREKLRESVAYQLKENGIAVLPVGVRAVIARRENIILNEMKGDYVLC